MLYKIFYSFRIFILYIIYLYIICLITVVFSISSPFQKLSYIQNSIDAFNNHNETCLSIRYKNITILLNIQHTHNSSLLLNKEVSISNSVTSSITYKNKYCNAYFIGYRPDCSRIKSFCNDLGAYILYYILYNVMYIYIL